MELTVDQALQQGVLAHQEGRLKDAERLYRAILQAQPSHPDANHNLGVLAESVGKPLAAIPLFELALKANPQIEQFWLSYLNALITAGHLDKARKALMNATNQGVAPNKIERFGDRLRHKQKSEPENEHRASLLPEEQTVMAATRKGKGSKKKRSNAAPSKRILDELFLHYRTARFAEAEALAVSLTRDFPEHPFAWKVLGAVLKQKGKVSEALPINREVVRISPRDAEAQYNLATTLKALGKLKTAESNFRTAIAIRPDYVEAHNNLGVTLKALGRQQEAKESYETATILQPDNSEAHYNLGAVLNELGNFDKAKESYLKALTLKPDFAEAHRAISLMKQFQTEDDHLTQMKALYEAGVSDDQRCHLCFAMAKAYGDLEEYSLSFRYYKEGNDLRKKQLKYEAAADANMFKKLKRAHSNLDLKAVRTDIADHAASPIFIVGLPRSGTTLVEQIVSSHFCVTGAGELPFASWFGGRMARGAVPMSSYSLEIFRRQYLSELADLAEGNSIVTDKMPLNFRYLGLLGTAFPECKIIHVIRDPAAVCWANYETYFPDQELGYCYDINDILSYFGLYADLMQYWRETLTGRIYELDYELLTNNQEEETRKLINYLGLSWDDACLSPEKNKRSVATASNSQVRQRIYQGSSKRWKHYRPYLNGALDHLDSIG